jgi:hypothetical protein
VRLQVHAGRAKGPPRTGLVSDIVDQAPSRSCAAGEDARWRYFARRYIISIDAAFGLTAPTSFKVSPVSDAPHKV